METQKVLHQQGGADLNNLHAFFVVEVEKEKAKATSYETEAVLNYGWIDGNHLDRLLPILRAPNTIYTPRMLKFVFSNARRAKYFTKQLSFSQLNKLYQTAYSEAFLQKAKYKDLVLKLRADLTKELHRKKQILNLHAVYELDEVSLESLLKQKNIEHP